MPISHPSHLILKSALFGLPQFDSLCVSGCLNIYDTAMFCSAVQPKSLKAPTQEKAPRRARDRPLEKVRMLHKQTGDCTNIQQRFHTQSQPISTIISVLSPPLFFLSLSFSLYPCLQSRTHQRHLQLRPSLTLAALDRDALALHRAASSCCIASDAYPGTAEGSTMS